MYRIKKILNVNVVLVNQAGKDYIAFGKGIGYGRKVGSSIDKAVIQQRFVPVDGSRKSEMIQSLNNIPDIYVEIATEIIELAERELHKHLLPSIYYSLTDHLYFAVQRYYAHQTLGNRIYWEMKTYYPRAFAIGEQGLANMDEKLHLQMPREEAANTTFHVINCDPDQADRANVLEVSQLVDNILQAVRVLTAGSLSVDSLNYERFVTHVKFFAERYLGDAMLHTDDEILAMVYKLYPEASKMAIKVEQTLITIYGKEPTKEELAYLIIHIHRVTMDQ